jgi:hypothetical protein
LKEVKTNDDLHPTYERPTMEPQDIEAVAALLKGSAVLILAITYFINRKP